MPYLSLTNTNGTDFVSPVTSLNNNWDTIDSKFKALDSVASPVGTGVTSPEQGIEFVGSGLNPPDIGVWDTTYNKIAPVETWGSWQTINLAANFSGLTSRIPALRVSSLGRVQCRGAVQYQTGTTAWPTGFNVINSGQFAQATYCPAFAAYKHLNPGPITGTSSTSWAYGQAQVDANASFLRIQLIYVGAIAASGNNLDLGNLNWYVG
jgi:hypothetical protein